MGKINVVFYKEKDPKPKNEIRSITKDAFTTKQAIS